MKKVMTLLTILCSLSFCCLEASDKEGVAISEILPLQKNYVDYQQLIFSEEGIFLTNESGQTTRVQALFHDEGGYYFLGERTGRFGDWICCNCRAYNNKDRTVLGCWKCGHRKCEKCRNA